MPKIRYPHWVIVYNCLEHIIPSQHHQNKFNPACLPRLTVVFFEKPNNRCLRAHREFTRWSVHPHRSSGKYTDSYILKHLISLGYFRLTYSNKFPLNVIGCKNSVLNHRKGGGGRNLGLLFCLFGWKQKKRDQERIRPFLSFLKFIYDSVSGSKFFQHRLYDL